MTSQQQQQLPGGGGVRSLRAMFESSHPERSASPELRGRSPTPGSPSVRSSESNSRPTSKVRASFISVGPFDAPTSMPENGVESPAVESPAVESPAVASPEGIDLIKGPPDEANSTAAQRRGSMSLDPHRDSDVLDEVKKTVSNEAEQRRASIDIQETVPEQAVLTGPGNTPFPEIKENEAMGSFIDNAGNKLADPKKSSEPGPKEEPAQETAQKVIEEAAKNLRRVELAAEEKKSESAHKSSSAASDAPVATPLADLKKEVVPPVEEPTMTQPDKKTDVEETDAAMKPADPKDESAVSKGEALPPPTEPLKPLGTEKPAEVSAPVAEQKVEEKVESLPEEKANAASEPVPEPKSPEKQAEPAQAEEAKPSGAKSPVPPETPTSPIASPKSTTSKTSSAKAPAKRTSRTSLRSATSTSAPKPRASSRPAAEKKKETTHTTPPFTKPRPKSPTRPAKLPSHLTQPTAASAAKRDGEKAEEKKPAARPKTTTPRAPAVASKTTTAAASKTAADAKKAGSRPSLPAQGAAKRPESRTSRPSVGARAPDDSFLARMMRPTAASASKTHEKKDDVKSPPRRTVPKPKQTNGTSAATKAKTKVVEGIDKAKEKILDKDISEEEEKKEEEGSSAPKLEPAAPITEKAVEEEKAAEQDEGNSTPPQSGETMTQTPAGIEGGVIRQTGATQHEATTPQIRQCHCFDGINTTTSSPSGAAYASEPRSLRSFSTSSSMTAYSSASTSFTASTAPTSVFGTPAPTSTGDRSSTPSSSSLSVSGGDNKPRKGRISNLVAFFENK